MPSPTETAVPAFITRDRYVELIRSLDLGLDPADLVTLELGLDRIRAEKYERDENGQILVVGKEAISSVVEIPVVDGTHDSVAVGVGPSPPGHPPTAADTTPDRAARP